MSGESRAVIWLGLIMIAINLTARWPLVHEVIFGSKKDAKPKTQAETMPAQVPANNSPGITVM